MIKVEEKYDLTKKKTITLVMALANKIMKELNFTENINKNVKWDKEHWGISPGGLAKAVVLATFTDIRVPLTHLQERLSGMDLAYLIGEEAENHDINAFNAGRALERIGESDCNQPYETMALSALQIYDIPAARLHSDTTTLSFYGEYDVSGMKLTEEEEKELLCIEKGYNKDGRPGCRQAVVGQIVNEYGIPLNNQVMDGSTPDVKWNKNALDYLDELRKKGFTGGVYVADSKLVTHDLVSRMNEEERRVAFVSRCPASFEGKLGSRMTARAYERDNWEDLGQMAEGKKSVTYRGVSYNEHICGTAMRLLVVESSALLEKSEAALEKEEAGLGPLIREMEKKEFVCAEDAEKEYSRFVKRRELKLFKPEMQIVRHTKEKWPRGRRNEKTKPVVSETYQIRIPAVRRNEDACRQYIQNASCFVLISNITDENITDTDLLKTYKGQYVVENSFRQLKGPSLASVIYLKNPTRIKALEMLLSFALLIRALIQYRLRDGLKTYQKENPDTLIYAGWAGRPLKNPTFKLFYEHSVNCRFEREARGEYSFTWPDAETKQLVVPLLSLMGLTPASVLQ